MYYNYYFGHDLLDYNPKTGEYFHPKTDNLHYILKDTYFFDMNGDGRLDFIHFPLYSMHIIRDFDAYELFIQLKDKSYKWVTFLGYISAINFNADGSLANISTYQAPCCDDDHCFFRYYEFDKATCQLNLVSTNKILTCQLIRDEKK